MTKRVVCTDLLARTMPERTVHRHLLPSHLQQTPGAGRDVHDGRAAPGQGRLVRGGSAAPPGHPTELQDGKYSIAIKFFSLEKTFYFFDSSRKQVFKRLLNKVRSVKLTHLYKESTCNVLL